VQQKLTIKRCQKVQQVLQETRLQVQPIGIFHVISLERWGEPPWRWPICWKVQFCLFARSYKWSM